VRLVKLGTDEFAKENDLYTDFGDVFPQRNPPGLLRFTPKARLERDALYWHYPHYHPGGATPYGAIRARDWRLVEFYEDMHVELYNLKDDVGEKHDRAKDLPEKAAELRDRLHAWRQAVGAQMPAPNPDYKP
jgi:arylsulfatase A